MDPEIWRAYLTHYASKNGGPDMDAACRAYMEPGRRDSAAVRKYFRSLEALLQFAPPYVHDEVMDTVCCLLEAQERTAFLDGLRAGLLLASGQEN